jgi:uncharacterized protein YukE
MAGNLYGADVVELRLLSERMSRSAADLDRIVHLLSHQITATTAWVGPNAQRFRGEWSGSHRAAVASSARALRDCSAALRRNADEQDRTSAADSSSTGLTHSGRSGGMGAASGPSHPGGHGGLNGVLHGLFDNPLKQLAWATLTSPTTGIAMLGAGLMPGILSRFHVQEIRLGDDDNHVLISADGTISVKAQVISTELTFNQKDASFKTQLMGLGMEHTKEGAWGVFATPGVHVPGVVDLSAGLDVTYNPHTGVIAPSGEYQIGLGHLAATDGSIHRQWDPATGNIDTQVSMGGELSGARHEVHAADHNGEFASLSTIDSLHAGPVTVTNTHSQSLTADGSFVDSEGSTTTAAQGVGFSSTYFALKTEEASVSHSNMTTTTTTADGTRTTANASTNSGSW